MIIENDTCLFALAGGRTGAGTANKAASSTACWGATVATCRDASTTYWRATTTVVTSSGAAQTIEPGHDHTVGLVAPLHESDVNVVQCGHCCQQRCHRRLVHADGLTDCCRHHELNRELVRGQRLQACDQQGRVQASHRPAI
jgi:hypothetical protein